MKIQNKKFNNLAGLALAASLSAVTANATILAFDGFANDLSIPDTFGDNISAAETGILVTNGITPNIDITWDGAWEFYNDAEWSAAQLDSFAVGANYDVTFTASSGFAILVDSFIFDDYAGFATGNKFNWELRQDSATGSIIASGTETTTDGQNLTVNTGMSTAYAGSVVLRFNEHPDDVSASGGDQAIDSISFTQVAVPEPSSTALLGLGGLGLLLRRRRV